MKTSWFVGCIACLLIVSTTNAGAIFQIIGTSPSTLAHPSGQGNQAASASWGISSTGGGFLDGKLEFDDSFALPANQGDTVSIAPSDVKYISFSHIFNAFTGVANIAPVFSFYADQAHIVRTLGSVVFEGTVQNPQYRIVFGASPDDDPPFLTSVDASLFVLLSGGTGGVYAGEWGFDNTLIVLNDAVRTSNTPLMADISLITNSQYQGRWLFTGFADPIPTPATGTILVIGLAGLLRRR